MGNINFEERNRRVFDSMPNVPYLGSIPQISKGNWGFMHIITKVAAVLFVPLAIYFFITYYADREGVALEASPENIDRVYTVNNGVKGKVTLPDSTIVWLNSGTTLSLCDDFHVKRQVNLSGEGYFDVKADKKNPFYINTGKGITVKVTGTEFNLSCYENQGDVKLCLLEGVVELLSGEKTIYRMKEHEEVSVLNSNVVCTNADAEYRTAWMQGKLVFNNTPMDEVIKRLEKWYGVRVVVENSDIYKSSFTGEFRSESIVQILELLKITSGISYYMESNEIHLF